MTNDCPNASEPSERTVRCKLLPPNVRINRRVCGQCRAQWPNESPPATLTPPLQAIADQHAPPRPRGLGDTIEAAAKAIGLKACAGCERRRDVLNRLFPYR